MSERRCFIDGAALRADTLRCDDDEALRYLSRALRLRSGDVVEFFDGCGGARRAELRQFDEAAIDGVWVESLRREAPRGPTATTVLIAHLKGDLEEEAVSALAAAGFGALRIYHAERGDRLRGSAKKRLRRLRRICRDSCRQSGGHWLSEVGVFNSLDEALAGCDRVVFGDPEGLPAVRLPAFIGTVVIGPEGGFSPAERDQLLACGAQPVSLGPRVLRARHAASILPMIVATVGGVA